MGRTREETNAYNREQYKARRADPVRWQRWKDNHALYRNNDEFKEGRRIYRIKLVYGLTAEDYDKMLKSQGGVCKICKGPEIRKDYRTGKIVRLAVDHDPITMKVRGLLCDACNRGLGFFRHKVCFLESAASYMTEAGL